MTARILVIEDDSGMSLLIRSIIEAQKLQVDTVTTLADADTKLEEHDYDLITLDVNLPDGKGISYCSRLRSQGTKTPVIMITTEVSAQSVIAGLQAGADDYLRKPIQKLELEARLRAHLRRAIETGVSLEFNGLVLNLDTRAVTCQGKSIELTGRQFDILAILIRRPEVVFSRDQIITALGREAEIYDRTVDSHLSQLRKKLHDSGVTGVSINSVYGAGYRLE